ncbi:MAG: hypothetical protein Q9208_004258 [Pyrenodesmia sp. 3 TL-2023]
MNQLPQPPIGAAGPAAEQGHIHLQANINAERDSYPMIPPNVNPFHPGGSGRVKWTTGKGGVKQKSIVFNFTTEPLQPAGDPWYFRSHQVILLLYHAVYTPNDCKQTVLHAYRATFKAEGWMQTEDTPVMRHILAIKPEETAEALKIQPDRRMAWAAKVQELRDRSACYRRFVQLNGGVPDVPKAQDISATIARVQLEIPG